MVELPVWLRKHESILDLDRLAPAYLIYGRHGLGKKNLINNFASRILCHSNKQASCNECQSCNLVIENQHPDLQIISREEGKYTISIKQIFSIKDQIYETPFLGNNKVFIIHNLENMVRAAFDPLLKILEEPPKNTYFLMDSNFINRIPSTIRSRSAELEITLPSDLECREWLSKSYRENIALAIELSNNRPFIARDLLNLNILELRSNFIKDISGIIKSGKDIVSISEQWIQELETLPLKIEWMSYILVDSIKHAAASNYAEVLSDSENITRYLGEKSDVFNLHELLIKTNEIWNLFNGDTNLRKEYQLQSLFVDWEKDLGVSNF